MSSSLLRQHRWKQFWAATICAASFAGGTLVFGQEPLPSAPRPTPTATGMAPVVSGASLRRLPPSRSDDSSRRSAPPATAYAPVVNAPAVLKPSGTPPAGRPAPTVGPATPVKALPASVTRPASIAKPNTVANPYVSRSKPENTTAARPDQAADKLAPVVTGPSRPIGAGAQPSRLAPIVGANHREATVDAKPTTPPRGSVQNSTNRPSTPSDEAKPIAKSPVELPSGPPAHVSPWMKDIRETLADKPTTSSSAATKPQPESMKAPVAVSTPSRSPFKPAPQREPEKEKDTPQRLPSTAVPSTALSPAKAAPPPTRLPSVLKENPDAISPLSGAYRPANLEHQQQDTKPSKQFASHLEALKAAKQGLRNETREPELAAKPIPDTAGKAPLDRRAVRPVDSPERPAEHPHAGPLAPSVTKAPAPIAASSTPPKVSPPIKSPPSKPQELFNPHVSKPLAESSRLQPTRYEALSKHAVGMPLKSTQPKEQPTKTATPPQDHRVSHTALQPPSRIPAGQTAPPPAPNAAPAPAPAPGPMPMPAPAPRVAQAGAVGPFEMIGESSTPISVMVRRSMLLRTRTDIYRTAVVDAGICDVVQFTPREISIIGKSQGSTHVTFWFDDPNMQPVVYLVKVEPDAAQVEQEENKYKLLEDVVNEMFPDSKIQLILVADKLIVKGQAKDSEEATQIMSIIRTQSGGGMQGGFGGGGFGGGMGGFGGSLNEGMAADVLSDTATGAATRGRYQVIDMLRVPGVQQVALRVKIAELNRTAARGFGVDVRADVAFSDSVEGSSLFLQSLLNAAAGNAPALITSIDGDDIQIGIRYLQQQGVIRMLSEPTLVTMSGRPATFIAGGEFAVPTIVGSAGLNAVTTDFRAFGAIISFLPTVIDKDRMRLQVSPEFSQINQDLAVNGTPGLKTRAATTTVEMREGQTLAIAGLLEDNMNATTAGDLPFLARVFGRRGMQRAETELIILVTPELVHPMEPEEVPPLPGFDVTEPTNGQFFLHGAIEGNPTREYRSTVWPRLKKRYGSGGPAMTSGPFGHGN